MKKGKLSVSTGLLITLLLWLAVAGGLPVPGSGFTTVLARSLFPASLDSVFATAAPLSRPTFTTKIYLPLVDQGFPLKEKIAFETLRDGNYEVYLMDPDGSDEANLTNHPAKDVAPAWSPDGRRLAFVSDRDGNEDIYVMDRDGTGIVRLTHDLAEDGWPTWSPDGAQIAFQSERNGNYDIYVMNADGSDQRPLTTHQAKDRWPDWSPDGTRIAFTSNRYAVKKICVMHSDGSDLEVLSRLNVGYDDFYSTWSPDGRITFVSNRTASGNGRDADEIFIMNSVGSNIVQLTDNEAGDWLARWSPDGARFAFYSDRDGNKNIFAKTLATGSETPLTDHPGDDEYPAWSP